MKLLQVSGIMLNCVTGSAPIKEHIDVPSCREYTQIVSLQKGSLGTIGWNETTVEALRKRQKMWKEVLEKNQSGEG